MFGLTQLMVRTPMDKAQNADIAATITVYGASQLSFAESCCLKPNHEPWTLNPKLRRSGITKPLSLSEGRSFTSVTQGPCRLGQAVGGGMHTHARIKKNISINTYMYIYIYMLYIYMLYIYILCIYVLYTHTHIYIYRDYICI